MDQCPSRLRNVLLTEFHGRIPTLREVTSICDQEWSKMPGMGRKNIEQLHRILCPQTKNLASYSNKNQPLSTMATGTLFTHLAKLGSEMRSVIAGIFKRNELFFAEGTGTNRTIATH
jgi:DNA repair protein RadC